MSDKLFTYGPDNIDQLLSTTLSKWAAGGNLEDQVFSATPLWKKLYAKAKKADGGASILQPVMYGKNTTAQSYDDYDILDTTPQDGFTLTQAKWKNQSVSISIAGPQIRKNSGAEAVLDLLQQKTDQAVMSLKDLMSQLLFGTTNGSTDITSLYTMINATSTIQDVNSTTNSWWQATVTTGGSFTTQGINDMRTTDDTIGEYNPQSVVDVVATTKAVKNYYEASLVPNLRYSPATEVDPTFKSLKFRNADVFNDPNCNSGTIYMFSTDDLQMWINSNADMKTSEFVKPSDQDAKVAQIFLMCELVTRARRKLAKITSITA